MLFFTFVWLPSPLAPLPSTDPLAPFLHGVNIGCHKNRRRSTACVAISAVEGRAGFCRLPAAKINLLTFTLHLGKRKAFLLLHAVGSAGIKAAECSIHLSDSNQTKALILIIGQHGKGGVVN